MTLLQSVGRNYEVLLPQIQVFMWNGKRYLIVSFDTMWQENREWSSIWLKAYPIKKDGTPSKKVETIYADKERIKRV